MDSMAEMITGYPLFRGRDNADQLVQIMKIVGTPSNETLAQIKHDSVRLLTSRTRGPTDK
jgi:negative regulator of PHO system